MRRPRLSVFPLVGAEPSVGLPWISVWSSVLYESFPRSIKFNGSDTFPGRLKRIFTRIFRDWSD